MSTIGSGSNPSRSELKKEILEEIHQEERHRKFVNCLGCLFLKLLLFLIPVVIAAALVAQSGFFEVPLLSKWLYHPSTPQRTVVPLVGYDSEQIMKAAMTRADYNPTAGQLNISLTEQELTTMARAALVNTEQGTAGGGASSSFKTVQMAVSQEGIEFFAVTPRPERDVTIKILFLPAIDAKGELNLTVKKLEVGSLDIPSALINLLTKTFARQMTQQMNSILSGAGRLVGVKTGEKTLYLNFQPELKLKLPSK